MTAARGSDLGTFKEPFTTELISEAQKFFIQELTGPDLTLWGPRAPRYVGAPRKMKNEIMVGKNGYFYQSKRLSKKTLDLLKYKTILTHN